MRKWGVMGTIFVLGLATGGVGGYVAGQEVWFGWGQRHLTQEVAAELTAATQTAGCVLEARQRDGLTILESRIERSADSLAQQLRSATEEEPLRESVSRALATARAYRDAHPDRLELRPETERVLDGLEASPEALCSERFVLAHR